MMTQEIWNTSIVHIVKDQCQHDNLPKIYRDLKAPLKISMPFLKIYQMMLNFIWSNKMLRIAKEILGKIK